MGQSRPYCAYLGEAILVAAVRLIWEETYVNPMLEWRAAKRMAVGIAFETRILSSQNQVITLGMGENRFMHG